MFEPDAFGATIFKNRYSLNETESWLEAMSRVSRVVAAAEENGKIKTYADEFYDILIHGLFMPGGRIVYGSGRPKAQLLNCNVIPTADSREGWGQTASDVIIISGTGGGVGINFSPVRPRGSVIHGHASPATGSVSLMEIVNQIAEVIRAGGGRRAALMMGLNHDHPDIPEFINKKLDLKQLNNANVSIVFMNESPEAFLRKVEKDELHELTWKGQVVSTIPARQLWDKILDNAVDKGEPGILNGFLANQTNNLAYWKPLVSTNPCVTGDTLIAVADGRNAVPIKQLAAEKSDIPVYCTDPKTGQTVIRMGRNPRKTGERKEVWRVVLDDGSTLRATPTHGFLCTDHNYLKLNELTPGQPLASFSTFNSNGYRQITSSGAKMVGGARRNRRQYRLIWEWVHGFIDPHTTAIHHKNFDSSNDTPDNLIPLSHKAHRRLHSELMQGKNNPYHRMNAEWKHRFAAHHGKSNGRYSGFTNEEILEAGRDLFNRDGKVTQENWVKYAKEQGMPQHIANKFRFNSFSDFKHQVSPNHKVLSIEFDGYEDVFNITVDEHHNYNVITSTEDQKYITSSGVCLKNCGEIWLEPYGCCDLGSLVLPRFITKSGTLNKKLLARTINTAVRFLDDVLEVNYYPLKAIEENAKITRRVGLGVMGLHDMLIRMSMKYSSDQALEFVDSLFSFIKKKAYEASIFLAAEKGQFPALDRGKFVESGFCKSCLSEGMRERVMQHGIRNCALITIAPTGTTSIVQGVSSGIEPILANAYYRNYLKGDELVKEVVEHPLFTELKGTESVKLFENARDIPVEKHLQMQKVCQAHVDNSISKTINLPKDYTSKSLDPILRKYLPYLKGVTLYRDGSRGESPIQPIDIEEAIKVECPSGTCEL